MNLLLTPSVAWVRQNYPAIGCILKDQGGNQQLSFVPREGWGRWELQIGRMSLGRRGVLLCGYMPNKSLGVACGLSLGVVATRLELINLYNVFAQDRWNLTEEIA